MKLAVCAIFKDEAPFLVEWVIYHRLLGVDHFFLYDNESGDGGGRLLEQSGLGGMVTIIPWHVRPGQPRAYAHFFAEFARGFDWVAVIDVDEFIFSATNVSLKKFLVRATEYSAVLLNWLVFGSSGHDGRPHDLVIDAYDKRVPNNWEVNRHVKSIVRISDYLGVGANPHVFEVKGAVCNSNLDETRNLAIQNRHVTARFVINHYFTKSRQDWTLKLARGKADTPDEDGSRYDPNLLERIAEGATVLDVGIQRYSATVRKCIPMVGEYKAKT